MKSTIYVIPTLACFVLVSLTSLCAADDMTNNTASWLPSDNQTVNCLSYSNCSGDSCHFKGTQGEILNRPAYQNDESIINCGSLKVDLRYPTAKSSSFVGNRTSTCFHYENGNGTTFDVAQVFLTKPEDVRGNQVNCTYGNNNNCTLLNETASQIILVAGFPSNCTPWSAPAPTTPAPTGPGSNTTGVTAAPTAPTTQGPVTTTKSPGAGARLEIGMSVSLAVALLICRYL